MYTQKDRALKPRKVSIRGQVIVDADETASMTIIDKAYNLDDVLRSLFGARRGQRLHIPRARITVEVLEPE